MNKIEINKYKSILVALDLSSECYIPLEKAIYIKEQFNIENFNILHVVNLPTLYTSHAFISNIQEKIYDEGKKNLHNLCEKYNIPETSQHVSIGSPLLNIIDFAKKTNTDLIIVGSHSEYHLLPASLGSTAASLLNKIDCDLLTVTVKQ